MHLFLVCLHEPPWTKRPMTAYSSRSVAGCSPARIQFWKLSQGPCEGGHAALASSVCLGSRWDDNPGTRRPGRLWEWPAGAAVRGRGVGGARVVGHSGDGLIYPARGVHNRKSIRRRFSIEGG